MRKKFDVWKNFASRKINRCCDCQFNLFLLLSGLEAGARSAEALEAGEQKNATSNYRGSAFELRGSIFGSVGARLAGISARCEPLGTPDNTFKGE